MLERQHALLFIHLTSVYLWSYIYATSVQASAVDASEERDDALAQLDAKDQLLSDLQAQLEQAVSSVQQQLIEAQAHVQALQAQLESDRGLQEAQVTW